MHQKDYSQSPQRAKNMKSPDFYDKQGQKRVMESMNLIVEPVGDIGGIWLGSLEAASDLVGLKRNRIAAVLSLCPQEIAHPVKQYLSMHQNFFAEDIETFDISQHFEKTYDFIDKARKATNILIHCYAGISRSTTVLIAFLMRNRGISVQEGIELVRSKRWHIYPNSGFLKQLHDFESQLYAGNNTQSNGHSQGKPIKQAKAVKFVIDYDGPSQKPRKMEQIHQRYQEAIKNEQPFQCQQETNKNEQPYQRYQEPIRVEQPRLRYQEQFKNELTHIRHQEQIRNEQAHPRLQEAPKIEQNLRYQESIKNEQIQQRQLEPIMMEQPNKRYYEKNQQIPQRQQDLIKVEQQNLRYYEPIKNEQMLQRQQEPIKEDQPNLRYYEPIKNEQIHQRQQEPMKVDLRYYEPIKNEQILQRQQEPIKVDHPNARYYEQPIKNQLKYYPQPQRLDTKGQDQLRSNREYKYIQGHRDIERKLNGSYDALNNSYLKTNPTFTSIRPLIENVHHEKPNAYINEIVSMQQDVETYKHFLQPTQYQDIRRKYLKEDNKRWDLQENVREDLERALKRKKEFYTDVKENTKYERSYVRQSQTSYGTRPFNQLYADYPKRDTQQLIDYQPRTVERLNQTDSNFHRPYSHHSFNNVTPQPTTTQPTTSKQQYSREPTMFSSSYFPQRPYTHY